MDISQDNLGKFGDDFYEVLTLAHKELSTEESARLNIRLVLMMANAIGDIETIKSIIAQARAT